MIHRRTLPRKLVGGVIVFLLFAFGPFAAANARAASGELLEGSVEFASAALIGNTEASTGALTAAHLISSSTGTLAGTLDAAGSEIVVKWFRSKSTGVGESSSDRNASLIQHTTEETDGIDEFADGHVSSLVAESGAALLVLPRAGAQVALEARTSDMATTEPSGGQEWAAGQFSNATVRTDEKALVRSVRTVSGEPVLRAVGGGDLEWAFRGDFVLVVWGADVTVSGASGTRSYRTGDWWENATGPGTRGTARDEYMQLIELHFTNGALVWRHDDGVAQWTAAQASTETQGTVAFARARGDLVADRVLYAAHGDSFQIQGRVRLQLRTSESSAQELRSAVQAFDSTVSLAGEAAPRALGSGRGEAGALLWALTAAVILIGGAFLAYRQFRVRNDWAAQVAKASDALLKQRVRSAARRSNRLVRLRPGSADAWVMWGESHLARHGPAVIIGPLEKAVGGVDRPALLQFLLTIAYMEIGNRRSARRWLEAAWEDEDFARDYQTDPRLAQIRSELGIWPKPRAASVDVAEAYA